MLQPLEQVLLQVSRTDQQLQVHLILEQQETNRLLRQLLENKQEDPEQIDEIDNMKRPDLMKRFAQLSNKPIGWNKWDTEAMRRHIKHIKEAV